MRRITFRCSLVASAAVLLSLGQIMAGPPPSAKSPAEFNEPHPKIIISAGATVRRIGARFDLNGGSPAVDWERGAGQARGLGRAGIFKGGRGEVAYEDGSVGPGFGTVAGNADDGTAFGTILHSSQVYDTGRIDEFGDPIFAVDFHTHALTSRHSSVAVSDDEVGVGPYLQAAVSLVDRNDTILNAIIGWSLVQTDHNSGAHRLVTVSRTDYTYTYDTVLLEPLPSFPYTDPANASGLGAIIIDGGVPFISPLGKDPTESSSNRGRIAYAIGSADLDVMLNEVPIGLEFGRRFGKLQALLTGGVTLNIISYDLESRLVWHRSGGSTFTERWRDDDDAVRIGFYGGLVLRYPLCESGRVFLEARGSYRWVDPVHAQAGFASVEIDPSSWEGGLGLCIVW